MRGSSKRSKLTPILDLLLLPLTYPFDTWIMKDDDLLDFLSDPVRWDRYPHETFQEMVDAALEGYLDAYTLTWSKRSQQVTSPETAKLFMDQMQIKLRRKNKWPVLDDKPYKLSSRGFTVIYHFYFHFGREQYAIQFVEETRDGRMSFKIDAIDYNEM